MCVGVIVDRWLNIYFGSLYDGSYVSGIGIKGVILLRCREGVWFMMRSIEEKIVILWWSCRLGGDSVFRLFQAVCDELGWKEL